MSSPQPAGVALTDAPPRARGRAHASTTWRRDQIIHLTAFALLLCATAYRVVLIGWGWPIFDSDQAVIGLMARHIWLSGERPLFFYGQSYMGPGEAYVAAPFFALLGSSALSLRLAMLPLMLLFLVEMYLLGRAAYGPVAGLLTLAWLTVGPSIAVYRGLTAEGGAQESLVLAGLILLCIWSRLRIAQARPHTPRAWLACVAVYGILGIAYGWTLWSDWLFAPLLLLTGIVLLLARPRELFSWAGVALLLGFVGAAWPFLQFNATHQLTSLDQALHFSGADDGAPVSRLARLPAQLQTLGAIDLPAIFGSPHICLTYPADVSRYHWMARLSSPGGMCAHANELFSALILALFALAAWPVVSAARRSILSFLGAWARLRSDRMPPAMLPGRQQGTNFRSSWTTRVIPLGAGGSARSAQLWLRGVMLLNALALTLAFANNPMNQAYPLDKSRYLVPLYLSTPLLFGALWSAMRPLWESLGCARGHVGSLALRSRSTWRSDGHPDDPGANLRDGDPTVKVRPGRGQRTLALAATLMLALLLSLSVSDGVAILSEATDTASFGMPLDPPWIGPILTIFDTYDVHTFYAESYYDCYRIAFESNERQVCAVLGSNGRPAPETWLNRYAPYVATVAHDPHPAYLFYASTNEASTFARGGLPASGYVRITEGSFALYVYAKPATG